jgi:hypothetical protein
MRDATDRIGLPAVVNRKVVRILPGLGVRHNVGGNVSGPGVQVLVVIKLLVQQHAISAVLK